MGFPDTFRITVSDTQAYRQFGNSVVMPVMREVARAMMPHLDAALAHQPAAAKTKAKATTRRRASVAKAVKDEAALAA
jgi:DNA (cytosine-5)-methyltransferase 1